MITVLLEVFSLLSVVGGASDSGMCRGGFKGAKPVRGFLGARVGSVIRRVLDLQASILTRRSQGVLEKLDPSKPEPGSGYSQAGSSPRFRTSGAYCFVIVSYSLALSVDVHRAKRDNMRALTLVQATPMLAELAH